MSQLQFTNLNMSPLQPPTPAYNTSSNNMTTNNIIITAQPGAERTVRPQPRDWSSGLCACCDDFGICLFSCCCPCCQQMFIAQDMGESGCNACCYACCVSPGSHFGLRVYMRGKENIRGSLIHDYSITSGCLSCCCFTCALAQLAREVKHMKATRSMF